MVLGEAQENCVFKGTNSHILYTIKMVLSRGGGVSLNVGVEGVSWDTKRQGCLWPGLF